VRSLLDEALDQPAAERDEFVRRIPDEAVRDEVAELLAFEGDLDGFMHSPAAARSATEVISGPPEGAALEGFRIERLLDSGGMGTVFLARQESPRRLVALKVLRASLATPELRRRFAHESEILGRLQNPAIAHVYGTGTWSEGGQELPWFAMEYVEGARDLRTYATEEGLGQRERIRLMLAACDGVHHAHLKSVVHRDLKPSNIVVDTNGTLKVIDFGCAQLGDQLESAALTRTGEIIGTLAYMPPEQFEGGARDVDVRGDVYSLGVVLFELVTGCLPIDMQGSLPVVARRIREAVPPQPSQITKSIPAELDWIVMRAIEKERQRRYPSVSELAADLRRFLASEPVQARPPSRTYLLYKFVQRHRTLAASGLAVLLVLIGWAITASVLYVRATEAGALEQRRKEYLEVAQAFFDETFFSVDPGRLGPDASMVEVLRAASLRLASESMPPEVAVSLHNSVGSALFGLGKIAKASEHFEQALELTGDATDLDLDQVYRTRTNLAYCYHEMQRNEEAGHHAQLAYTGRRELLGPSARQTLNAAYVLAVTYCDLGLWDSVADLLDICTPAAEGTHGAGSAEHLDLLTARVRLAEGTGALEDAEALARQVADGFAALHTEKHPKSIEALSKLAQILGARQKYEETLELLEHCLELRREVFGPDHASTLREASGVGAALSYLGRDAESEAILRDAMARATGVLDEDSESLWALRGNLAQALAGQAQYDEARDLLLALLDRTAEKLGVNSVDYLVYLNNYARFLERAGLASEARPVYDELGQLSAEVLPVHHALTSTFRLNQAKHLVEAGHFAEAEQPLLIAHESLLAGGAVGTPAETAARQLLVRVYEALQRSDEAERYRPSVPDDVRNGEGGR